MNLQNWVRDAKAHWKEFLPKRYAEFEKAGILNAQLQDAAERTSDEMSQLQNAGLSYSEAWERVRSEYLFLPEEPEAKAKQDREQSPNVSVRTYGETAAFKSEMLRKIRDGDFGDD